MLARVRASPTPGIHDVGHLAQPAHYRQRHAADDHGPRVEREAGDRGQRPETHADHRDGETPTRPDAGAHDRGGQVHERPEDRDRYATEQGQPGVSRTERGPGGHHRSDTCRAQAAKCDAGCHLGQCQHVRAGHDVVTPRQRLPQRGQRVHRHAGQPEQHQDGSQQHDTRSGRHHHAADDQRTPGGQDEQHGQPSPAGRWPGARQRHREVRHERPDRNDRRPRHRQVQCDPRRAPSGRREHRRHDGRQDEGRGQAETERQHVALGQPGPGRGGGRAAGPRWEPDLDQWPPSTAGPPSPALNRPIAPRPGKLNAWVTIG